MTDIKSKILQEVEEQLGSGAVMVFADAIEKCQTLSGVVRLLDEINNSDCLTSWQVIENKINEIRGE